MPEAGKSKSLLDKVSNKISNKVSEINKNRMKARSKNEELEGKAYVHKRQLNDIDKVHRRERQKLADQKTTLPKTDYRDQKKKLLKDYETARAEKVKTQKAEISAIKDKNAKHPKSTAVSSSPASQTRSLNSGSSTSSTDSNSSTSSANSTGSNSSTSSANSTGSNSSIRSASSTGSTPQNDVRKNLMEQIKNHPPLKKVSTVNSKSKGPTTNNPENMTDDEMDHAINIMKLPPAPVPKPQK